MNDNELSMTPFWARAFRGESKESLLSALGVLAGLVDDPEPFENVASAIRARTAKYLSPSMIILRQIAEENGLTIRDLKGGDTTRSVAYPRQEAYVRLRDELGLSYPTIARLLGRKDHTTVKYGYQAFKARAGQMETRKRPWLENRADA